MTARVVALMRPVGAADRRRQVVRGWIRQHFVFFAALIAILATGFGAAPASAVVAVTAYDDAAYTYATPAQLSTTNVATTHARGSPAQAGAVVWGSPVSNGRCVVAANTAGSVGDFVGPLTRAESEGLLRAVSDPNKMNHLFGKAQHGFDPLVSEFGSPEAVVEQMYRGLQGEVSTAGRFTVERAIGGRVVHIDGATVDGVPRISTAWVVP